jgi:hypothetical protein
MAVSWFQMMQISDIRCNSPGKYTHNYRMPDYIRNHDKEHYIQECPEAIKIIWYMQEAEPPNKKD